jgi:PAS domain S-box-containing protein
MQSILDWLFDAQGLTPHGFCLLWQPELILIHAAADIGIGLAYFSIPLALAWIARKRPDLAYRPIAWLFVAFILLCGTTHFIDVLTLWVPAYAFQGMVKSATAIVSIVTAAMLWVWMPKLLALPSPIQLREANEALRESQAHYRASFEQSPVPMLTASPGGVITDVSDSWSELFGYPRQDIVGRPLHDLDAPGSSALAPQDRARLMEAGEVRDLERRLACRDGTVIDALVSARLERRDGQTGIVCVITDVTARRRAEEALRSAEDRLRQAQKMEAIGQLTGGVAHDFNNMLQGIGGCLDMMERRIAQGRTQDAARFLPTARQAVDRAAHLTSRMLAFARRQTLQPRPIDPDRLILDMEELLRRTLGPGIDLSLGLHDGRWLILCDAHELESALLNAAINSRDAMPQGGQLRIATEDRMVGPEEAQDEAPAGAYVAISVIDTGTGMSPATMQRMFDPFFTTKPTGEGTGLGLSQLYGFVRQSGGFVRVDSALGRGTTITLFMPRHTAAAGSAEGAAPPATPPVAEALADGARVLLIEDDPHVRAVVSEALHDLGCTVLEANDGVAGWQIVQSDTPIDLLITDVGLPGMNGRELAEAARTHRPGLPVLVITGYAGPDSGGFALPPGTRLLRKPFALGDMTPLLAEMLRQTRGRQGVPTGHENGRPDRSGRPLQP